MQKIIYKSIVLTLLVLSLLLSVPRPQTAATAGSLPGSPVVANEDRIALHQTLLDLQSPWTVMCIAAHPDDEDGTSLTVLRHKYGVHTVSLFSTFGEGGQNAIGPELYEELGAIRVRETMAAAEIQGSEPHFLGMKDFGFSKSADEAFKVWSHEEPLRRMVLEIRQLRPDVIITNHDTTSGHGHHQATGRLELEAFAAAADPQRFPEQLKDGVTTWQVQRLFVRTGFGGAPPSSSSKPDPGLVTLDPNEADPARGTTYAEQALAALQKHATQGPWPRTVAEMAARFRGSNDGKLPMIRYRLTREAAGAATLPLDAHSVLDGLSLPEKLATQLAPPTLDGRPLTAFEAEPERVLSVLLEDRKSRLDAKPDQKADTFRFHRFWHLANEALVTAAGLKITITPENPLLVRDSSGYLAVNISNRGTLAPWVLATSSEVTDGGQPDPEHFIKIRDVVPYQIQPGKTDTLKLAYRIGAAEPVTVPRSEHLYDGQLFKRVAAMHVSLKINGVEVALAAEAPFDVAPPVEIAEISPLPLVIRPPTVGVSSAGADIFPAPAPKFNLQLINHLEQPFKGEISFGEANRKGETNRPLELLPHQSTTLALSIPSGASKTAAAHSQVSPAGDSVWFSIRRAGSRTAITTRRVPVVWANAHVAQHLRVGYVRGFDFSLPHALEALGVDSHELSVAEVKTADLQQYSTIIVDNRVYESQPELIAANQRLLDYAKAGGTLVVFYHKSNEWNPDQRRNRPQLAPYPLTLGEARITDENAAITFIEADHPLLNTPNKIGPDDFQGWIQERGLYYPREWDAQYHALFSANDPGEAPLKGGLLVADYGRGHYIYTSMVWYRQLRAGVPGGYRMFANMISYGHQ